MTVESTIDYEGLAQEAMRGVVRKVLARTAKSGLAGDHHFYISFDTEAPGVILSRRLKEKYPHEMTIVLQHRFWDLIVTEERFEVKLTFDGIPERLVVPFDALKVFFDPSVRFGLQFEDPGLAASEAEAGSDVESDPSGDTIDGVAARGGAPRARTRKPSRPRKPAGPDGKADGEADGEADGTNLQATPIAANSGSKRRSMSDEEAAGSEDDEAAPRSGGAEIVSLDKFRKK